jgi:hypothetical protein
MQDAMMSATETVIFEQPVRVADEIPIGEEKQLHEIERLAVFLPLHRPRASRGLGGGRAGRRGCLSLKKLAQKAWLRA